MSCWGSRPTPEQGRARVLRRLGGHGRGPGVGTHHGVPRMAPEAVMQPATATAPRMTIHASRLSILHLLDSFDRDERLDLAGEAYHEGPFRVREIGPATAAGRRGRRRTGPLDLAPPARNS